VVQRDTLRNTNNETLRKLKDHNGVIRSCKSNDTYRVWHRKRCKIV